MTVRLTTLGHPRVVRGEDDLSALPGKPVTFGVFVFVAVEEEVTRDRLAGVFWPESPQDKARHALSQTLYEIRQALGEKALETSGSSLRAPDDLWVDCLEFSRWAEEGDHGRAVSLYTGAFLDGVHLARTHPFQEWVERHRASLARRFRGAADRFITQCRSRNELNPALKTAWKWSGLDPLDDGAQHQLIQLLAETGKRTEALVQFERYAKLLQDELGLDPLEETVALVEGIKQGAFASASSPDWTLPPATAQDPGAERQTPSIPADAPPRWPPPVPGSGMGEAVATRASDRADLRRRMESELFPSLEILRPIGSGSMGDVFLAREPHLKRLVAVKVLSPHLYSDREARSRFEREAQAAARIQSPFVCTVYRVGSLADGTPYFVSPFVKGTSLEERLRAHGRLRAPEVRRVLQEVAAALAAAHKIGIVHRDVRPGNVLRFEETGRHSLCDFGIAGVLETGEETGSKLTRTGEILGDPAYISPEQLDGMPLTDRTDVFSLGILGHELLLGHTPPPKSGGDEGPPGDGSAADLAPLMEFMAEEDPGLASLLRRCLAEDPAHRPRAQDLVMALEENQDIPAMTEREEGTPTNLLDLILRKRLPQILGGYLASAWATVEAVDFFRERGSIPDEWLQVTLVSATVGFFVVSVLGWFHGEKGRQPMPPGERWLILALGVTWLSVLAWVLLN